MLVVLDSTRPFLAQAFREGFFKLATERKKKSGLSWGKALAAALPIVAATIPMSAGKNYLEQNWKERIQSKLRSSHHNWSKKFQGLSPRSKPPGNLGKLERIQFSAWKRLSHPDGSFNSTRAAATARSLGATAAGALQGTALTTMTLRSVSNR